MSNAADSQMLQPSFNELGDGTRPFYDAPGFCEEAGLWLYGNMDSLSAAAGYVSEACGRTVYDAQELSAIERKAEEIVLDGRILVCGFHNFAHRRAAVVPLRWGAPRIVVMSGGFRFHLGDDLDHEPFQAARLWRYKWDPITDLAVSRRAPEKSSTFASLNPTVDRLIKAIASREIPVLAEVVAEARLPR